jgi:hypothetical protein
MPETVIIDENLSKRYPVEHQPNGHGSRRYTTLRDVIGRPWGRISQNAAQHQHCRDSEYKSPSSASPWGARFDRRGHCESEGGVATKVNTAWIGAVSQPQAAELIKVGKLHTKSRLSDGFGPGHVRHYHIAGPRRLDGNFDNARESTVPSGIICDGSGCLDSFRGE